MNVVAKQLNKQVKKNLLSLKKLVNYNDFLKFGKLLFNNMESTSLGYSCDYSFY